MSFFNHVKKTNESESSKTLAKGKVLKVLGAAGLAFFMGGTALFGALWTPTTASAASGPSASSSVTDPFEVDPENDKIIADLGGLEIRFHNVKAGPDPLRNGITYIKLGSYTFYVVACHSSMKKDSYRENIHIADITQEDASVWDYAKSSPAQQAILMEYMDFSFVATSELIDKDLKPGQLFLVTNNLQTRGWSSSDCSYAASNIKSTCDSIYSTFTERQKKFVVPVDLITYDACLSPNQFTLEDQTVFLPGGTPDRTENFHGFTFFNEFVWSKFGFSQVWTRTRYAAKYVYDMNSPTTVEGEYINMNDGSYYQNFYACTVIQI